MTMGFDLPSYIATNNASSSIFYDEEISVVSGDLSTFSQDSKSEDMLSFFKRKLPNELKKIQVSHILGDLKDLASTLVLLSAGDEEFDTNKGKCEMTNKKMIIKPDCNDEIETDSITEVGSQFDHSDDGEDISLARLLPEGDDRAKTLEIDRARADDEDIQAQPIPERRSDDSTAGIQVDFPKNNRRKQDLFPVITAFQSMTGRFFPQKNDNNSTDIECEDNWQKDIDCDPPTKEEYIALEKDLVETKLELAITREELDRASALMNRANEERDWLRSQYSSLQYKYHNIARESLLKNEQ